MDLGIEGRAVLITGAASGIGLATAELFAQEGCNLELWDCSPQVLDVAERLRTQAGVEAHGQVVDVTDWPSVLSARDAMLRRLAIRHIVHCAAVGSGKFGFPFTQLDPGDWERPWRVNVQGMVHVAHALTETLVNARQGSFVFLASVAGQIGSQTDPPYRASKAANINFAQCMAKDLAVHGVRVNTVCPGMVQTPLNRSVWQAWYEQTPVQQRLSYEAWAEQKIRNVVPLGRWQAPEDVAAMIVFLSSDRARQITGQTINVDGGFVMHC